MNQQQSPPRTLVDRLQESRRRVFVGRDAETALWRDTLDGRDPATVVYVHGPGGIGKSMLLHRYAELAGRAGRPVWRVDCRTVGSTAAGLRAAIAPAAGLPNPVIIIDTFERCQRLEPWLWQSLLPELDADSVLVVAGRNAPDPRWRSDLAWSRLLRTVALSPLSPADSGELLRRLAVPAALQDRLVRLCGGSPLALTLAANDYDPASLPASGTGGVEMLLTRLVGHTPTRSHRRALETCAHALFTSVGLLREVVGDEAAELFDWLRRLPFVEAGAYGLYPHDVVREVLDADLRWRAPDTYRSLHTAIRRHFASRIRESTGTAALPSVAALNHLHRRNDATGPLLSGWAHGDVHERAYRDDDRADLLALAGRAAGPAYADLVRYWLDRQPEAFRVHHGTVTRRPIGFLTSLLLTGEEIGLDRDPVVGAALRHLRGTYDVRPGERVSVIRFLVDPDNFYRPSPSMDLSIFRITADILAGSRIAATFVAVPRVTVPEADRWAGFLTYFGFDAVPEPVRCAGGDARIHVHDWRLTPVGLWRDLLDQRALDGPGAVPAPGTPLIVLTRPAFDRAVRDALTGMSRPGGLVDNPLLRCRLAPADAGNRDAALRELILATVAGLRHSARRAVTAAFLQGAVTRDEAAARAGHPESTFKRHLATGVAAVSEALWQRELDGTG